ncbi:hypothetical protein ACFX1T_046318 [Malus domestica]
MGAASTPPESVKFHKDADENIGDVFSHISCAWALRYRPSWGGEFGDPSNLAMDVRDGESTAMGSSTTKLGDGISPETGRWYLPRQNLAGNLAMDVREGENTAMGSSNTKLGDGISPETGRRYLPRQNLAGSSLETMVSATSLATMVSATTKFSDGSSLETVVSATTKFGDGSSLETGRWYLPRQNLAMEALAGNGPVVFAPTKFGDGNSLETSRWYPPRQNLAMEARWKRAGGICHDKI